MKLYLFFLGIIIKNTTHSPGLCFIFLEIAAVALVEAQLVISIIHGLADLHNSFGLDQSSLRLLIYCGQESVHLHPLSMTSKKKSEEWGRKWICKNITAFLREESSLNCPVHFVGGGPPSNFAIRSLISYAQSFIG